MKDNNQIEVNTGLYKSIFGPDSCEFGRLEVLREAPTRARCNSNRLINLFKFLRYFSDISLASWSQIRLEEKLVVSKEKAPSRKDKIS